MKRHGLSENETIVTTGNNSYAYNTEGIRIRRGHGGDPYTYMHKEVREADVPLGIAAMLLCPEPLELADDKKAEVINAVYAGLVQGLMWAESPAANDEDDNDSNLWELGFSPEQITAKSAERLRGDATMFVNMCLFAGIDIHRLYNVDARLYPYNNTDDDVYDWESIGSDFWLTRNSHGSGFFEREDIGIQHYALFDHIAQRFNELYVYITDDGEHFGVEG